MTNTQKIFELLRKLYFQYMCKILDDGNLPNQRRLLKNQFILDIDKTIKLVCFLLYTNFILTFTS